MDLEKGNFVKVRRGVERFWVIVDKIGKNGFIGIVDNEVVTQKFKLGDRVCFNMTEIVDILEIKHKNHKQLLKDTIAKKKSLRCKV